MRDQDDAGRDDDHPRERAVEELGLADPKWSDDQLLDFMMADPIPTLKTEMPRPQAALSWASKKSATATANFCAWLVSSVT